MNIKRWFTLGSTIIALAFLLAWVVNAGTTVQPFTAAPMDLKTKSFTLGSTGTVVSAVSGKKIKVYAYSLSTSATISVGFRDGASTAIGVPQTVNVGVPMVETVTPPYSLFSTSTGTSLDLVTVGTGTVSGRVSYWDTDSL